MNDEKNKSAGHRLRRSPATIRSWDGPNSRIGCETDLSQMPWEPFDALGKEIILLVPVEAEPESQEGGEDTMERALRFVDHAIKRSSEFASLGDGGDPSWQRSKETWEWIRDRLTAEWLASESFEQPAGVPADAPVIEDFPKLSLPGAARTLEVASLALRSMPLATWRDAVATLDPDMPTREETIQTLKAVAGLLSTSSPDAPEETGGEPEEAPVAATPEQPVKEPPKEEVGEGEVSFDYAQGFDEGYHTGRKVGRALAAHELRRRG